MNRPRLLDLFCGAGGAAMGYYRAGFEVVGVDIKPQPHYPFEFHQADALTYPLEGFDAYHASPPCQGYCPHTKPNSRWVSYSQGRDTPKLILPTRIRLQETGHPYVIENVEGARKDMVLPITLCGSAFDRPIPRHRLFEANVFITNKGHRNCHGMASRYARENGIDYRDMSVTDKGRHSGCLDTWKTLMGIDWEVTQSEIVEMIFPAYTEYIGKYLMQSLNEARNK